MKKILLALILTACQTSNSQVGIGTSVVYGNSQLDFGQIKQVENQLKITSPSNESISFGIKGLHNIKPEYYTAIFEMSQIGKSVKEVDEKLQERINEVLDKINTKNGIEHHIDMISLVPRYSYDKEKKIFSKNSYNEIPEGFELKKNMHLKFKDGLYLNELVTIMAQSEIYNLVRVEAYSDKIEEAKIKLKEKALETINSKIEFYSQIKTDDLKTYKRQISDGFTVLYPSEGYTTYSAHSTAQISDNSSRSYDVQQVQKSKTSYFQPLSAKQFDFVLNPGLLVPYIQVVYSVNVNLIKPKEPSPIKNKYMVIGQNGTITELEKFE